MFFIILFLEFLISVVGGKSDNFSVGFVLVLLIIEIV